MNPERLGRLRQELEQLLALSDDLRARRLADIERADAALARALAAALADAERDDPAFEPLIAAPPLDAGGAGLEPGARLGPWCLVRALGQGGMGQVWLAERADGAYAQRVAIKVPHATAHTTTAFTRFERERSLLAEFDHPGIARLVDGGWTGPGRPWLAMEYVEGQRIDEYAGDRALDGRGRVHLLLAACRVLAAAHRRRIVHRDLKPQNLLVRADGRVALVDFGIAAVLDDPHRGHGPYLATPRYAAPEQLRGGPATTAADVFSLGVVGCELVSAPDADLAAVFAAATHPDPERRTANASLFADELERWLAHRPVAARPAPLHHRARLFARRDPRGALAVGALTIATLGLLVAALVLWRAERGARERADAALAAEAQQHRQVRQLVGELMSGVHDRVEALPGAVPVRAFLVERAEAHLGQLAARAADDADLAHEVTEVQLRVADVRGMRTHGNLGDPAGALATAEAALGLARSWSRRQPGEARWPVQVARCLRTCGDLLRQQGDLTAARARYEAAVQALAAAGSAPATVQRLLAILELQLGKIDVAEGAFASGQRRLAGAAAAFDRLSGLDPEARDAARDAALAHAELGYAASSSGDHRRTLAAWQTAHDRLTALATAHPDDAQVRRDRLELALELGLEHARAGQVDAAVPLYASTLAEVRALHAADRANVLAERLLHRALLRGGRLATVLGDHRTAAARYREAEPLLRARRGASPGDREVAFDLGEALAARAEAERLLGETEGVAAAYEEALVLVPHAEALARGDHLAGNLLTLAWVGLGNLALASGDPVSARARFAAHRRDAAAWAERFATLDWPLRHLGALEYGLGSACEAAADAAASPAEERRACLAEAEAAFARGLAIAERLAVEQRLVGAERAMPRLFAADVARVRARRAALTPAGNEGPGR